MSQLYELSKPFSGKYVQKAPQGTHGDYVAHPTINERLLQVVGPFSFEVVDVIRGYAAEIKTSRNTFAARENAVVGVVARLIVTIDGRTVSIDEVGAEDNPAMKGDGDNLKSSLSDALKRCAMRLGLGLHLWSGDMYFLDRALEKEQPERPAAPALAAPAPASTLEPAVAPEQPDEPQEAAPTEGGGVTVKQLGALAAALKKQDLTRDQARAFLGWLFDRVITSSKELTKAEASRVIGWDDDAWMSALYDYAEHANGGPPEEAAA